MVGGASHLVNFLGSDTIAGIWMANKYYGEQMSGFSIPACYDDISEILTDSGFKLFNKIVDTDLVAQYHKDGTISFIKPDKIHIYDWQDQNMINFESPCTSLSVTSNHKLVRFSHAKNELEVVKAENNTYSHRNSLIVAGYNNINNQPLTMVDRLKIAFLG